MHLYGKEILKRRLDSIAAENRMPHAIMLCGERGSGRRVMANYIAKLFLCGAACDSCTVCKKIDADAHADVIFPKRILGGKYKVDELREVITGMSIKPNDGDIKVYIFEDTDEMLPICQNTLLKIIEEPMDYLRFVFTCENVNLILETILSRVTEFNVQLPSEEECAAALIERGTPQSKAKELSALFSGNIGKCAAVLEDGTETKLMESARRAAEGIAKKSRYLTGAALSEQTGRAEFACVLEYLTGILRDALAAQCGGTLSSCGKKEAAAVARVYGSAAILSMLEAVFEVSANGIFNLNLALSGAYLSSKLIV